LRYLAINLNHPPGDLLTRAFRLSVLSKPLRRFVL
jgi:hypothetical protein